MAPCLPPSHVTPPLQPKNHGDRMWSFRRGRSYHPHDLVMGFMLWEPHYLLLHCYEISSPTPPTHSLFPFTLSPAHISPSSSHQHPEAQKQTSVTCCPQKSALVPPGASSSLQEPRGQEDTSSWHQDPTQTSPDARQGTAPDGHCGRRGNGP